MISEIPPVRFLAVAWTVSRARAAMRAGLWAEAAGHYAKVVAIDRTNAGEWVQYGHALKESGDLTGAEAAYREAVRLAPHDGDPHRQLGFLLKRAGRGEAATACFIDGLAVAPDADDLAREVEAAGMTGVDLNVRLTVASLAMGAPSPLERRRRRPMFRGLRLLRAIHAADRAAAGRNWAAAAAGYRAALDLDPYRSAITVQLGHALKEQGNLRGAVAAYRRALASAPHDPDPHLHLGHAYKLLKDSASSITAYANAWRLQPGFGDVERELHDFAGWSTDVIRTFAVESWSAQGTGVAGARPARATWVRSPGLDMREEQVWSDLTHALGR